MGFWSGEKTITVSSTVYNLAGDENKRANFLQTTILGGVLSHSTDKTLGQQLNQSYITGPGIKLRGFSRWCRSSGYDTLVGLGATSLMHSGPVNIDALVLLLPAPPEPQTITVQNSFVGLAQYTYWVEQWMLNNFPEQIDTDWKCDFNEATVTATVILADTSIYTFTLTDYSPNEEYLYATYYYVTPEVPEVPADPDADPPVEGSPGSPEIWGDLQYLIYKKGSGNPDMDALFVKTETSRYFLPYIPIMVDRMVISPTFYSGIYNENKKAVRKALGNSVRYDSLTKKIFKNPSIATDVDYIYITFGVSANVRENACRMYIYEFLRDVKASGTNTVIITSSGAFIMNYFMQILWTRMVEVSGSGHLTNASGNPAKVGEVWFQTIYNIPTSSSSWLGEVAGSTTTVKYNTRVRLNWQVTSNSWRYLEIDNLQHINMIYGGKAVTTTIVDALTSTEESGFIFPLNEAIYKDLSLVDSTQMSTACAFLVFNCYTVKKAPWYATGWFKIILVVVGIALSIFTGGAAGIGLLGSNLAVGTMLGLEGTAAVIAGAIANAIAAMVVVQIVQFGALKLFGPKLGALIGSIVSIFALGIGTGLSAGLDFSQIFSQLTSPMNLLKITEAAGNAYAQIMQGNAQDIVKKTQTMVDQYNALSADVEKKTQELLGVGGADLSINPLSFTEVDLPNVKKSILFAETPDSFFQRTLLSGSDIADLSMSFVNSFCDLGLSTKLFINPA